MQSGISVSKELSEAFQELTSNSSQRGLIATIESESIQPSQFIPSSSPDFFTDISSLQSLLSENQAAYVILRRYDNASDGYVAVTYVPDTAPIRQKMLFASTRLTLVRELGNERFRETFFATDLQDLGKEGWDRHDASEASQAPLTQEEETLKGVKDAEADARGGTEGRRLKTAGKLSMAMSSDARRALEEFKTAPAGTLLQLRVAVKDESVEYVQTSHADPASISTTISDKEPRYSLYKSAASAGTDTDTSNSQHIFIYTCPSGLSVKERMLNASSKAGFLAGIKQDLGIEVGKKLEATDPTEIEASDFVDQASLQQSEKPGFSRPKRPGKR